MSADGWLKPGMLEIRTATVMLFRRPDRGGRKNATKCRSFSGQADFYLLECPHLVRGGSRFG